MNAVAEPAAEAVVSGRRAWLLHLWAYLLPSLTLVFLLTGPHEWWVALLCMVPIWFLVAAEKYAPRDHRQPPEDLPNWPFDLHVYLLTALQLTNHIMLGVMASKLSYWPWQDLGTTVANFLAMQSVCGVAAGYSGIVLGHELVHRRKAHQYFLGRLLLMFVCYEHFATEHIRGHHPRIGTAVDPATARFGETLREFFRRTIPAQFKSAWHLDKVRLGDENMKWHNPRMIRHRVLQGVVVELFLIVGYLLLWGPIAMIFFLGQARMAIILLEAVNYVEHWGLQRTGKRVETEDSWDTDNWLTLHTLVGLSRHSDHHARASRPYHKLRYFGDSPQMPRGYYGTVVMAMLRNEKYMHLATKVLKAHKLGPFRPETPAEA